MDDFLRDLQKQQEMIRRLTEGPLRYLRENQTAIERARALMDTKPFNAMRDTLAALDLKASMPELVSAAKFTNNAFSAFALRDSVLEMQRYADTHRETYEVMERAALPYKQIGEQIRAMSRYLDSSHASMAAIDHGRFGELISASEGQRDLVHRLTVNLGRQHANLIASLDVSEGRLASVPPFVSELPTLDLFVHSRAVRSITPHRSADARSEKEASALRVEVVDETVAFLEMTLPELKPAFLSQYRGAKLRSKDRGPDWWTQGGASMRKLLKGVLHNVAPNELVLPWALTNGKPLDSNRKPTRATKVDWLCGFVPNAEYRSIVKTQMMAALSMIGLLDTSQHEDDSPEFEQQYDEIILRSEIAVRHILTIWKARRTH
jgi:hypothetical protein